MPIKSQQPQEMKKPKNHKTQVEISVKMPEETEKAVKDLKRAKTTGLDANLDNHDNKKNFVISNRVRMMKLLHCSSVSHKLPIILKEFCFKSYSYFLFIYFFH